MNYPLLSICIPTYNRADKLFHSLGKILKAAALHPTKIEVIVSDNASQDSTQDVIAKYKEQYPMLQGYVNSENLGFNLNFFALTDKYASGKYLWVIGDDDFLDDDAVDIVLGAIEQNPQLNFINLNFRLLPSNEAALFKKENSSVSIEFTSVERAIDKQARPENILATFLSCNIVKREKFASFDKSVFSSESWNNYMSVFPHSYILANTISSNDLGAYISTPLMSVCIHQKAWDNKLAELHLSSIVHVYKNFIDCGYKSMPNSHKVIVRSGLYFLFNKNTEKRFRNFFWRHVRYSSSFYIGLLSVVIRKILR